MPEMIKGDTFRAHVICGQDLNLIILVGIFTKHKLAMISLRIRALNRIGPHNYEILSI